MVLENIIDFAIDDTLRTGTLCVVSAGIGVWKQLKNNELDKYENTYHWGVSTEEERNEEMKALKVLGSNTALTFTNGLTSLVYSGPFVAVAATTAVVASYYVGKTIVLPVVTESVKGAFSILDLVSKNSNGVYYDDDITRNHYND